jgi:uncharacterized protein with HEPN domain
MERDARAFLWDVQQAANAIDQFIAGLDAAGYEENALAAVRDHRGGAESTFQVCPDIARRVSDLRQIVGFRNILIHGYLDLAVRGVPDCQRAQLKASGAADSRPVGLSHHRVCTVRVFGRSEVETV